MYLISIVLSVKNSFTMWYFCRYTMICNFSYNIKTSTSFLFLVCSYQLNIWYEVRVPSLTLNTQLAFFHLNTSFNYRGCFILSLLFSVRENGGMNFHIVPSSLIVFCFKCPPYPSLSLVHRSYYASLILTIYIKELSRQARTGAFNMIWS